MRERVRASEKERERERRERFKERERKIFVFVYVYIYVCCPLGNVDEWRRVSQNKTSLLDALFCLEPYSNTMPSTIASSHDHPLTLLLRRRCVSRIIEKKKQNLCPSS